MIETKEKTVIEDIPDSPEPPAIRTARDKILAIERELAKMPQFDFPLKHYFPPGIYAREIFIPKGCCLTGKIHKAANFNILSKGHLSVFTEEGRREFYAGDAIISPPGTKRVGYAHEDSIWTCIHPNPTDETDLGKLEDMFIAKNFDEVLSCLG